MNKSTPTKSTTEGFSFTPQQVEAIRTLYKTKSPEKIHTRTYNALMAKLQGAKYVKKVKDGFVFNARGQAWMKKFVSSVH